MNHPFATAVRGWWNSRDSCRDSGSSAVKVRRGDLSCKALIEKGSRAMPHGDLIVKTLWRMPSASLENTGFMGIHALIHDFQTGLSCFFSENWVGVLSNHTAVSDASSVEQSITSYHVGVVVKAAEF